MYSPKIDERLIPPLYCLARARRQPMTRLVSEVLGAYLARLDGSEAAFVRPPAAPRAAKSIRGGGRRAA